MIDMVWAELFKLRKRMMTWILLIVLVAFFCLVFFATYSIVNSPPTRLGGANLDQIRASIQFPGSFDTVFSYARTIGLILMIILTASSIGNEYGWGSIRQVLARRGIRFQYVASKVISFIVVTVIGLVISLIVGFVLSLIISNLMGGVDWSFLTGSFVVTQLENFGWTLFVLLPYILLATFFAFLGRSAIAGIGGGLGFYFIEAIAVGIFNQASGWLASVPNYLIGPNGDVLVLANGLGSRFAASATTPPTTLHASITLAVYCVVLLGVSLFMFQKRDITP